MFSLPWRRIGAVIAAGLVAAAVVLAVLDVRVRGDDGLARSCGSSFDVMAGRADWQSWRAQDLLELAPAISGVGSLTRAQECPTAVNGRTAWVGGFAIVGCVLTALSWPRRPAARGIARRRDITGRLAISVLATGGALTVAGLIGIAVLVANPEASLFLYVGRPVVVLIGLLLLAPAVALTFAGWALLLAVRTATGDRERGDDP